MTGGGGRMALLVDAVVVSTAQMRAVWSALQVARWWTSGERRTRVM
jgi:hypothetical protein